MALHDGFHREIEHCVRASDDPAAAEVDWHGDLFNTPELARQLGLGGEAPTEQVLRAAWQRWSADCLLRLDGVFVFALRRGDELFLYRDPSGLRSLYFDTRDPDRVAFATDLGRLRSRPTVRTSMARSSLHEYLRFLDIAAPNTLIEGVVAVEPGQLVRCTRDAVECRVLAAPQAASVSTPSFEVAAQVLEGHLQRSVAVRVAGARRPAAFLSGGIDSALICALARRQRPDVTAVTVGFEGAAHDEAPVAGRIAAHLGVRHEVLRFSHAQYLGAFERLSRQLEQPMADPATPATVLAFDHCREHFDTVLDGTGADEAVGAMPPRHVRLAVEYASLLPPAVRRGLASAMRVVPGIADYTPILDFEHPADTMIRWRGFTRLEIEALCGEPVSFAETAFYRTFARFPRPAHYARYSALINAMPCERLSQSMRVSDVRVRYPFLDGETDRFIRQLRTDWRYLPGQPKRILRALLARYVPGQIWDLPKHGFDFPLQQFLAADNHALVRRYIEAGRWLDQGLLRADGVRRYGRQFMAGDQRLVFRVWALVMLGAWLESHDELR